MPCLSQQTLRRLLTLATLMLLSATLALAQHRSVTSARPSAPTFTAAWREPRYRDWSQLYPLHLGGRLFVLTTQHPKARHTCHVRSFATDQLVCRDSLGVPHTYKSQDIATLIIPGEYELKLRMLAGFNAGLGAGIWATIVLAPVCPPCAAATALVALCAFSGAGAIMVGDDIEDAILYLAPGQTLQIKLRY